MASVGLGKSLHLIFNYVLLLLFMFEPRPRLPVPQVSTRLTLQHSSVRPPFIFGANKVVVEVGDEHIPGAFGPQCR